MGPNDAATEPVQPLQPHTPTGLIIKFIILILLSIIVLIIIIINRYCIVQLYIYFSSL